jgi:pantoate--beta-alanine ligase
VRVIETIAETRVALRDAARPLGMVPTMGFLHRGHLSLVRMAREENATVAASIFVNPTQFGPNEDLAAYPRDMPRDLALLEEAGVDLVFTPSPAEMYPPGHETCVDVGSVAAPLEGAARPGHFRGVATVVLKLFNIIQPDQAYFGQKDAQQLAVISRMVADLDVPVRIVGHPIVREDDGLALSSRNVYLNSNERTAATVLSRALAVARALHEGGERDASRLREAMERVLAAEPLARVDYVSVSDARSLTELDRLDSTPGSALASLAVRIGRARLIDNTFL